MAGAARNVDESTGFLIPWRLTADDLNSSKSTYTQDDPQPGLPEASGTVSLQPIAIGTQSSTTYTITTRQGGNVETGGAGFTWRESTDNSDEDRGWDAPNLLSSHSFIEHLSSPNGSYRPDAATLPNGNIIVVTTRYDGSNYRVRAYILAPGSVSTVNIYTSTSAPSSRIEAVWHPTVAVTEDGSILVAHIVEDTAAQQAQVNIYRSTDDGSTFSLASRYALPAALDIDSSASGDGYTIRRMRMRHAAGRTLLVIWAQVNNSAATSYADAYFQFGSDSEAMRFSLVEYYSDPNVNHTYAGVDQSDLAAPFGYPAITTLDGEFYVARITGQEDAKLRRLTNPFEGISEATGDTIATSYTPTFATFASGAFTEGECAIAADSDGAIYVTLRNLTDDSVIITRTSDKGVSWDFLGQGLASETNVWSPGSSTKLTQINLVAARGQLYCYCTHDAPTTNTYEGSLSEFGLGGWSSVTMAGNTEFGLVTGRAAWAVSYWPAELPGNLTEWTKTSTGAPVEAISTGLLALTSTGTETLYYTHTHSGTPAEGTVVEFGAQMNAGGSVSSWISGVSAFVEDGSAGYEYQVRLAYTGTSVTLYDVTAAGAVAGFSTPTLDWANIYEFRVEQRGNTVQGWYRVFSTFDDRKWTDWGNGTLTSTGGSGTPTRRVTFGANHSGTSNSPDVDFTHVRATYEEQAGVRTLPFTNPDDLTARDWAPVGRSTVIDGNYALYAQGGPGRRGDTYTGAPRYGYPVDVLHWPDSLSPRVAWRSTAASGAPTSDAVTLTWDISDQAEDTLLGPAIGVALGGIERWRTGSVRLETNGAALTTYNFDLTFGGAGVTFSRSGNTVVPNNASTSGRWLQKNEAKGWWVYLDGTTNHWYQVERNDEGVWAGGAGLVARLWLKDLDASVPTTGTMYLVPDTACIVIHLQSKSARYLKLVIDSQDTGDGRARLGCCWPGDVYVTGVPYELGARFTTTHGARQERSTGRVSSSKALAPPAREFEIGWTETAFTGAGKRAASDPNFYEATEAASAMPMSAPDITPLSVEGVYHYLNGERPVALLTSLPQQSSGGQVRTVLGRQAVILAEVTGTASIRHVAGAHDTDNAKSRGEAIAFRELI